MLLLSHPSGTLSSISEMEEREGERRRFCSAVTGQGAPRAAEEEKTPATPSTG
jgi:hypothetical protein